jgi:hypothetical protein
VLAAKILPSLSVVSIILGVTKQFARNARNQPQLQFQSQSLKTVVTMKILISSSGIFMKKNVAVTTQRPTRKNYVVI